MMAAQPRRAQNFFRKADPRTTQLRAKLIKTEKATFPDRGASSRDTLVQLPEVAA
jgi:hypothetical protein